MFTSALFQAARTCGKVQMIAEALGWSAPCSTDDDDGCDDDCDTLSFKEFDGCVRAAASALRLQRGIDRKDALGVSAVAARRRRILDPLENLELTTDCALLIEALRASGIRVNLYPFQAVLNNPDFGKRVNENELNLTVMVDASAAKVPTRTFGVVAATPESSEGCGSSSWTPAGGDQRHPGGSPTRAGG